MKILLVANIQTQQTQREQECESLFVEAIS
jgi:hypothetical protein